MFGAIDIDGSGNLTFAEFFVGLYNYLAGDQNFVQKMAFDMCDVDGGGKLSVDELRQLLVLVHGKGPAKKGAKELNKKIKNLMNQLDGDRSGTVSQLSSRRSVVSRHFSLLVRCLSPPDVYHGWSTQ